MSAWKPEYGMQHLPPSRMKAPTDRCAAEGCSQRAQIWNVCRAHYQAAYAAARYEPIERIGRLTSEERPDVVNEVWRLHAQFKKQAVIARAVGVTPSTVRRILKEGRP